jgi:hypothetical protein
MIFKNSNPELDKQNKIKQAYFQMFNGLELKDESYSARWSFEQEKEKEGSAILRISNQVALHSFLVYSIFEYAIWS